MTGRRSLCRIRHCDAIEVPVVRTQLRSCDGGSGSAAAVLQAIVPPARLRGPGPGVGARIGRARARRHAGRAGIDTGPFVRARTDDRRCRARSGATGGAPGQGATPDSRLRPGGGSGMRAAVTAVSLRRSGPRDTRPLGEQPLRSPGGRRARAARASDPLALWTRPEVRSAVAADDSRSPGRR